jgi:hypothetical protein
MVTDEEIDEVKRWARELATIVLQHARKENCEHCNLIAAEAFKRMRSC